MLYCAEMRTLFSENQLVFSAYFSFLSEYSAFLLFQESKVKFHVVGLKCAECGSYNTSREGEEGVPVMPPPVAAVATEAAEGEDEWETEEEEEIVGGETEQESEEQGQDDGVNLAEVQLDMDGDSNNVLPLD